MGTPQNQMGSQWGQQAESQWGQQAQAGAQWGQTGLQSGQHTPMGQMAGQQMAGQQMAGQQMTPKFGAAEILQAHQVLSQHIDGINQFELYRQHVKDQRLMQILDSQVNHMFTGYQNLVRFLQNQGMGSAVPYRAPKSSTIKYGLRQPSPAVPNASDNEMDDRDVASGMMFSIKASALQCTTAALESANPDLRNMMTNCAVSAINQAYEIFHYMNQKGFYQVPTLAEQTTQTMINTYQVGSQPQFQ
jgi:spore coat protein CotF